MTREQEIRKWTNCSADMATRVARDMSLQGISWLNSSTAFLRKSARESFAALQELDTRMKTGRKYYTLISRGKNETIWRIEFGDYSRAVVQRGLNGMCEHVDDNSVKYRIIRTGDTKAAVNAAVETLNIAVAALTFKEGAA